MVHRVSCTERYPCTITILEQMVRIGTVVFKTYLLWYVWKKLYVCQAHCGAA